MLWMCRDCGLEVVAADPVLVTTIGWTGLDGDTGVCSICSGRGRRRSGVHPRTHETALRHERSDRAVAVSRALIERARRSKAGDAVLDSRLDEAARRLGLQPTTCAACGGSGVPGCRACEGTGRVWCGQNTTIARSRLLYLATWPVDGSKA